MQLHALTVGHSCGRVDLAHEVASLLEDEVQLAVDDVAFIVGDVPAMRIAILEIGDEAPALDLDRLAV